MPTLGGRRAGQRLRGLRGGPVRVGRQWQIGSVAGLTTAQSAQCSRPALMDFPQLRQRFSARRGTDSMGVDATPFASRLCVWVKCVGGKSVWVLLCVVDHNCCATHSAIGATARRQIGTFQRAGRRRTQSRQLPSRCSKNHSRLRGCE